MLVASIFKLFYWPGARYEFSLLIQAIITIFVHLLLLKVALDNRPAWRGADATTPFKGLNAGENQAHWANGAAGGGGRGAIIARPYNFWRWRRQRPYWEFLGGMTLTLLALHTFLHPDAESMYTHFIGYSGLAVEAVLPVPQILANERARSCKGFRVSVLANWLFGDAMKMGFFFLSEPGKVPWAFKLCGIFQACCDVGLGCQYWKYGEGQELLDEKAREMKRKDREFGSTLPMANGLTAENVQYHK